MGNTEVEERTLILNQRVTSRIQTAFNFDRWRFSAVAGQQVRFATGNASSPGAIAQISTPSGGIPLSIDLSRFGDDASGDIDFVSLPEDGTYFVTVYSTLGQTANYSFQLVETTQIELPLGSTYDGRFVGDGQAQLFRVQVPDATPLLVVLDDSSMENHNELYVRQGLPPTRAEFGYRFTSPASSDQQILVPMAAPGVWYVLVYGDAISQTSLYQLRALGGSVIVDDVGPDRLADAVDNLLTVRGAGFSNVTAVEVIAADGTAYALAFDVHSTTQLTARLPARAAPPGPYAVRVNAEGGASQLDQAFRMLAGSIPGLGSEFGVFETRIVVPHFVGLHSAATIYVEYANMGSGPMLAPVLVVSATDQAFLTLDASRLVAGFWTSALPDGFGDTVQFLASGATPGILQPGESIRVPIYYAGLQQPWDRSDVSVEFTVSVGTTDDFSPIDWDALKDQVRPDHIPAETWEPIWANLIAQTGSTWGDYTRMLADNAAYLGRLGLRVTDVGDLFAFELQQAMGLHALRQLASAVDVALPAPGLSLGFARDFFNSITTRYKMGPLGRGWSHSWQESLHVEADGTVVIEGQAGSQRRFQPDIRSSQLVARRYFPQAGDYATLTPLEVRLPGASAGSPQEAGALIGVGGFTLREADGLLRGFRADGKLDYLADTNGNRISAGYTGDQLTSLTHSAGQSLTLAYNAAGLIESIIDSTGRQTLYNYDAANEHLRSVRSFDGRETHYTYATAGDLATQHALLSIQAPSGVQRFYEYDARGRLTATHLGGNAERVEFSFDSAGKATVTDAAGSAELFFNHHGLLVQAADELGNTSRAEFDHQFNLTRFIDAAGLASEYAYDARGNLTRFTDALGQTTQFTYIRAFIAGGSFTRLSTVVDAKGNRTSYRYNPADGNPTSVTYADGTVERVSYDALGNPLSWTNRRVAAIASAYNTAGQVTRKTFADGSQEDFTYDARGNLASATDAGGVTTFTYDAGDRLTRVAYPTGRFLDYTYDAAGRRIRMVDQDGFTVNYAYDAVGRLAGLTDGTGALIADHTYDAVGRVARKDLGNGTFTTYQYDAASKLLHLVNHAPDGAVNSRFDYTYDALGRRTSMATLDGHWTYEYDATSQLTHAVFDSVNPAVPDQDLLYEYDALGNRVRTVENGVTTAYVSNNMNQYTSVGTGQHVYDADGNLISVIDGSETATYTYNDENQLISVVTSAGTWNYEYDSLGNRVAVVRDGQRTEYLLDPTGLVDVVGEYDGDGSLIANYTHGLGLISRTDATGPAYYDFDAIGSTVGLTATGDGYQNRYSYLPFGEALVSSGATPNPFGFAGQFGVMQDGNGLDFMRVRFYSLAEGRFSSQDPIGLLGGDVNLYRYVANTPLNLIDPTGLVAVAAAPVAVAGALVAALGPAILTTAAIAGLAALADAIDEAREEAEREAARQAERERQAELERQRKQASEEALRRIKDRNKKGPWVPPPYRPVRPGGKALIPPSDPADDDDSGTARPIDPNQKLGPAGFGAAGYVQGDSLIPYRVDFENEPTATAPAQRVDVFDQLDADLDWDTFELTEVGFGDVRVAIPAGSQYFHAIVDMNFNDQDFEVEIELGLHAQTGQVFVSFQSIDPATFLPPDVLTGFLPPEDGTGRGQGYFSYLIRPRADLPSGAEIRNIAVIQFDYGEIIATNQVDPHDPSRGTDPAKEALVTLDAGDPTSSVLPLPDVTNTASFTVTWSGADDVGGSGTAFFDVFVSVDGGAFAPFLLGVMQTSATFTGEDGRTYAFYSVATDNVDHREPTPAAAQTVTRLILNRPPTADAGGPYSIAEGGSLHVTAASSSDPDGDALSYSWDINGDGVFGDAGGVSPTLSWADLASLGIDDGPSSWSVRVLVSDGVHDPVLSSATSLTVHNVSPTAAVSGPTDGVRGQSRSFLLQAADAAADAATGFTYVVDWGDGSAPETLAASPGNGSGVTVAHVFTSSRVYTIRVTAADKDGEISAAASHSIRIDIAAVQADPLDPDKRVLIVGGSTGDDKIDIKQEKGKHADDDEILIKINEREMGRFKRKARFGPPIDSIVVYGQAGDDKITVASQIDIPAQLFGDDGDDKLTAGGGPTTLVGGDGDDVLHGGNGRNVMIGGRGKDRLVGEGGEDLLIGGFTLFDDDLEALTAIMAEWNSNRSYVSRVANLRGDESSPHFSAQRANGQVFLTARGPSATVFDDNERDKLTGSGGRDWYFAAIGGDEDQDNDRITDLLASEFVDIF